MDITTFLLIMQQGRNQISQLAFYEIMIIAVLFLIYNFHKNIKNYFTTKFYSNEYKLLVDGHEIISSYGYKLNYPDMMLAISHKLLTSYNIKRLYYKNTKVNKTGPHEPYGVPGHPVDKDDVKTYCIDHYLNYLIPGTDIYLTVIRESLPVGDKTGDQMFLTSITLVSWKTDVHKFANKALEEYYKYKEDASKNNIYHFIYTGSVLKGSGLGLEFNVSVLSEKVGNRSNETFEHIKNEHSDKFQKDLKLLKDINFYNKHGLKRKKGYLFYGHPGCGKTSTIMAMAIQDNRHILEIPFSRIKTNTQFEKLLSITEIDGIKFNKDELIILFDELDIESNILVARKDNKDKSNNKSGNNACESFDLNSLPDCPIPSENGIVVVSTDANANIETSVNKMNNYKKLMGRMNNGHIDFNEHNNDKKGDDELHLGILLSRLDGIGNYDGLVVVATTNHIDKLDPALYRDMRLSPIFFDFLRKVDCIQLIEKFFEVTLTQEQIESLPDRQDKITPAKLISMMEQCMSDPVDKFLELFCEFVAKSKETKISDKIIETNVVVSNKKQD